MLSSSFIIIFFYRRLLLSSSSFIPIFFLSMQPSSLLSSFIVVGQYHQIPLNQQRSSLSTVYDFSFRTDGFFVSNLFRTICSIKSNGRSNQARGPLAQPHSKVVPQPTAPIAPVGAPEHYGKCNHSTHICHCLDARSSCNKGTADGKARRQNTDGRPLKHCRRPRTVHGTGTSKASPGNIA